MAPFNVGPKYLRYMQTRYFMNGANLIELGAIGRKYDALGSLDTAFVVKGADKLKGARKPNSTVQVISLAETGGGGSLKFQEPTDTVRAKLKASGSSTKVIIAELDFFDVLDGELINLLKEDESCSEFVNTYKNVGLVDTIVKVKDLRSVKVSDFDLDVSVQLSIQKMIEMEVGVQAKGRSFRDIKVSHGTVLAYRVLKLRKTKDGKITHKRDNPSL